MTALQLFGACDLTHETFRRMPAHMQTEAMLLMRERGYCPGVVQSVTRLDTRSAYAVALGRHSFRLSSPMDMSGDDVDGSDGIQLASRRAGLTRLTVHARSVLAWFHEQDLPKGISAVALEKEAGMPEKTAAWALTWLVREGYLIIVEPYRGNRATIYTMTAKGVTAAAELQDGSNVG